ncbi:metallophosphoesterase [Peptoniphilus catoniae]|uniref:metallophosphoesterase n=1 Tax=Peptoniphilus catoniae TaxID=1660341 RepID=UPI0010FD26F0|nr:metallophosphoesterase [Peptoniphilus catoniae]
MTLVIVIFLLGYLCFQLAIFKVEGLNIRNKKVNSEIKIVQISDFHNNFFVNLKGLKRKINKFNPDLVFFTGDMISRNTKNFKRLDKFVKIFSKYRCFFVTGNHELENPHIDYLEVFNKYGVEILRNTSSKIKIKNQDLFIYGLDFGSNSIPLGDKKSYNILLCHNPDTFLYSKIKSYDLVLSGHKHGGQVRLPYFGQIIDHGPRLFPKFSKGLYSYNNADFYISSGLGQSVYFRINCRISYTEILLGGN